MMNVNMVAAVCGFLMAPLACIFAVQGLLPLPSVVLIAQLCRYLVLFTGNLGVAFTSFAVHSVSLTRLRQVLDMPGEDMESGENIDTRWTRDMLELSDVGISYGNTRVLSGVDMHVKAGEIVALIGPSGSGKTSLIKALMGIIGHTGEIRIHGTEIRNLLLPELRRFISYVPEHGELFDAPVRDNVAWADPAVAEDRIRQSLRDAAITDGEDLDGRMAGECGGSLSGGQRQRVAIARALLKDAPLLILDEPTASLDGKSEAAVLLTLEKLREKGAGILLITHRESAMKIADRFMLIKDGTIRELLSLGKALDELRSLKAAPEPAEACSK